MARKFGTDVIAGYKAEGCCPSLNAVKTSDFVVLKAVNNSSSSDEGNYVCGPYCLWTDLILISTDFYDFFSFLVSYSFD